MRHWLVLENSNRKTPPSASSGSLSGKSFFFGFFAGFVCSALACLATAIVLLLVFQSTVQAQDELTADKERIISDSQLVQRPIGEIRKDVNAFLKNSKSDDLDLQVGGIIDLCYMHREIVNDPRFATYSQLKSSRAIAATRLKKYLKTIEIEKARKSRRDRKKQKELNKQLLAGENPAREVPQVERDSERPFTEPGTSIANRSERSGEQMLDDAMYSSMTTMGGFTGGPAQIFGYLSGNFAPPWDHGEELVALIESVIDPDNWQRSGGSHIIKYYRPSRIIIVGATSQVHDDITNMLRNLRRLSR